MTKVRDATKSIVVSVENQDAQAGDRNNPQQCALAKACMRRNIADGAIIGISRIWLIKGNVATRYMTSESVAREITSFDRHQYFAPGKDYVLGKIAPTQKMGATKKYAGSKSKTHGEEPMIHKHKTINIRKLKV